MCKNQIRSVRTGGGQGNGWRNRSQNKEWRITTRAQIRIPPECGGYRVVNTDYQPTKVFENFKVKGSTKWYKSVSKFRNNRLIGRYLILIASSATWHYKSAIWRDKSEGGTGYQQRHLWVIFWPECDTCIERKTPRMKCVGSFPPSTIIFPNLWCRPTT